MRVERRGREWGKNTYDSLVDTEQGVRTDCGSGG